MAVGNTAVAAQTVAAADVPKQPPDISGQFLDRIAKALEAGAEQIKTIATSTKPEIGFVEQMHWPDYIQAALLVLTIIALGATILSLRETSRGRDLENYLNFISLFDAAWDRFSAAPSADKYITFSKLMNLYESACDLYNRKHVGVATRDMLKSYLCQMLPVLWENEQTLAWINKAHTADDTFCHIKKFAKANKLEGVPHE